MKTDRVICGDCLEVLPTFEENSVDTVITDPPYHLTSSKGAKGGFMGKAWDGGGVAFDPKTWVAVLRVLKPGGILLAFGGTRTFHRLTCAIEDAGFEVRDCLSWLYGSGFPKSLSLSKAMDKYARREFVKTAIRLGIQLPNNSRWDWTKGEHSPSDKWWSEFKAFLSSDEWERIEREVIGHNSRSPGWFSKQKGHDLTAPATNLAKKWDGWGTALKPAWEPILLAMKQLEGTFAENAKKWGVAGLNIDGGRINTEEDCVRKPSTLKPGAIGYLRKDSPQFGGKGHPQGRFPANVILDEDAAARLDEQSGALKSGAKDQIQDGWGKRGIYGKGKPHRKVSVANEGGASRFFYVAKASRSEREFGLDALPEKDFGMSGGAQDALKKGKSEYLQNSVGLNRIKRVRNDHPTVKPIKLLEYLAKLTATPTGGIVLDPFAGTSTTALACIRVGRPWIMIEKEEKYCEIARRRIAAYSHQGVLFG